MTVPLRHVLPLERENRWSDLLAVLLESDPTAAGAVLGLGERANEARVRREYGVTAKDRVDLVLDVDGSPDTVIEVKLLSGLGPEQLERYLVAFPGARQFILVRPGGLTLDVARQRGWRSITWEALLDAFGASQNPWVAETARAWRAHLDRSIPAVGPDTMWNDLIDGEDFVLALRTRTSWVFDNLAIPADLDADLVQSSSGVSWVVRTLAATPARDYWILAEAEESRPNREWPKRVTARGLRPKGPSIRVALRQTGVRTSADFDWEHLLRLWPKMCAHRSDWITNQPRPRAAHDKAGIARLRAGGAPRFLGTGFGDAEASRRGSCMFGARFQLSPDVRLSAVVAELGKTAQLVHQLAQIEPR